MRRRKRISIVPQRFIVLPTSWMASAEVNQIADTESLLRLCIPFAFFAFAVRFASLLAVLSAGVRPDHLTIYHDGPLSIEHNVSVWQHHSGHVSVLVIGSQLRAVLMPVADNRREDSHDKRLIEAHPDRIANSSSARHDMSSSL
jgi:hypothetical protein